MTKFSVYCCFSAFVYYCERKRKSKKEGRPGNEAIFILFLDINIILLDSSRWKGTLIVAVVMNALQYHFNGYIVQFK